ncbi:MAG TPA: hypothetical protein VFG41_09275 [Sphingomicrobium sp.]|nr:hypothetical protein [Sphingomicrobium sp.]
MWLVSCAATVAVAGSALAVPAYAQKPTEPAPITVVGEQPSKKTPDPNEVVCEKQQEIGSRIATKRVCLTRSQWDEQRRLDRQDIDKAQVQRPMG